MIKRKSKIDTNDDIPSHWVKVNLIDLLLSLESGSRPKGGVKKIISGIPSIGGEHVNSTGGFDFTNIKFIPPSFVAKMTRGKIEQNDILIVKDGATTGKTSFVNIDFPYELAYVNEHVFICRPSNQINPRYLFWFLWSNEGNKIILENFKGSAQGGINTTFASNCLVPLAPINEQNKIAIYIDELISKLQAARVLLEQIPSMVKEAKQKILAAAISGELTKEWRVKNNQSADAKKAWENKNLGSVIKSIKSGKSIKCIERPPEEDEIGIVKVSAVSWGKFNEWESKTIPDKKYFKESYIIKSGDFLMSRANTTELVGACVIVDDIEKQLMLSDKILRIEFNGIKKEWALIFLRSEGGRSQIEKVASGNQEAMKNISQEKIRNISIPVPSIDEQKEIIKKVSVMLNKLERIEMVRNELGQRLKSIPYTILSSAFKGQLIKQINQEKNIGNLLEKIEAEKKVYEQTQKDMKKIKSNKKNETKISEQKLKLRAFLEENFSRKKFSFEDFKHLLGTIEYDQLKEELLQMLKSEHLSMDYNSKSKTYDYSFTKRL